MLKKSKSFTMKSLVVGHGRNHRQLTSIDYNSTVFVDRDQECLPDLVVDLVADTCNLPENTFDEILMANSSREVLGFIALLNVDFLKAVSKWLKPGGKFYMGNICQSFPCQSCKDTSEDLTKTIENASDLRYMKTCIRDNIQFEPMLVFTK